MSARELDAAGITDPALRAAYESCRRLNARHGKTYFLATRLLPIERRPAVHALYGFARWADDIVDDLGSDAGTEERAAALRALREEVHAELYGDGDGGRGRGRGGGGRGSGGSGGSGGREPVVAALAHTARRYGIDPAYFGDFLDSMLADLEVTDYATYADLCRYMHGSAAVIGLQMLPVLGTVTPREEAAPHAAALGIAFQLTNFLRDVGEDLDRGRIYLPADLLAAHGVDRELLTWSRRTGGRDARITQALRAGADLTRGVYRQAAPGIAMLDPLARPCIRTAFILYRDILQAIEADGYAVVHTRAIVPRRRRAAVALTGLAETVATRARATGSTSKTSASARKPFGRSAAAPPAPTAQQDIRQHPPAKQHPGMASASDSRSRIPLRVRRAPMPWEGQVPTWHQARPRLIDGAVKRAQLRPSGNWYAVGAARELRGDRPLGRTVAGVELVLWRDAEGVLRAGPGTCPHLGAPLKDGRVRCGTLICHWHGLALTGDPFAGWEPVPTYDDGVLLWVRLDDVGGEEPLERPNVPVRPDLAEAVSAVYTGFGRCEPDDIVANRLDPWHGSWLHPYYFVDLTVLDAPTDVRPTDVRAEAEAVEDRMTVELCFKVAGRAVVPVRAVFTAPGPRSVVMRITEGEGRGSVVETHVTPLTPPGAATPRTAVVEAVIAVSDRPHFSLVRAAAPLLRPLLRAAAGRLWRDDLAYAERRWVLRSTGRFPGWRPGLTTGADDSSPRITQPGQGTQKP